MDDGSEPEHVAWVNPKLHSSPGRLIRSELRSVIEGGMIDGARVRVTRCARHYRCRLSTYTSDGVSVTVETIGETRTQAVRMAVRRLGDCLHSLLSLQPASERRVDMNTLQPTTPVMPDADPVGAWTAPSAESRNGEPWGSCDERPRLPPVMLLLGGRAPSIVAMLRAVELARALDTELKLVLAISPSTSLDHGRGLSTHIAGQVEHVAGHSLDPIVVRGRLRNVGIEVGLRETVSLVVLSPEAGASAACELVEHLHVPVLVARDARPEGGWIAASNLQLSGYPVLATAQDYARHLHRRVTFFHNAQPVPLVAFDPVAGPVSYTISQGFQDDVVAAKAVRLQTLACQSDAADVVIARSFTTADEILALARERDADLVIVGHRARSWWSRMLGQRVTRQIAERCTRSVLIVPTGRGCDG